MPITHSIDHARRLVVARASGVVTDADVFSYQREVWSDPAVVGYNELVDMTDVTAIDAPNPVGARFSQLASLSAATDAAVPTSRFAIVAPGTLAYALGRGYQAYREMDARSKKEVGVFRTLVEALEFLGLSSL